MKLSRSVKILLTLLMGAFLFYLLFFKFYVETTPFKCAVCCGEVTSTKFYVVNCEFYENESEIENIDEIYKEHVNEKHSHIWVNNGFCERSFVLGKKLIVDRVLMLQPSFSSVYIFSTSLNAMKKSLKNGDSKNLLNQYHENIEQLSKMNLEPTLRAKYNSISDLLNNKERQKKDE